MTFAEKLAILREQKQLTQKELAERLSKNKKGVSFTRVQIGQWETEKNLPSMNRIVVLSDFFKVPIDNLCRDNIPIK